MSKVNRASRISTLFVVLIVLCCSTAFAQVERNVVGQIFGKTQTYNYELIGDQSRKLIWNASNKLFKSPMERPKGDLVSPNYILIPKDQNIQGGSFTKRFPPRRLSKANDDAVIIMRRISSNVLNGINENAKIVVIYYLDPNGIIDELEFAIAATAQISGEEIEKLERAIKSELRFVTESSDFKSGNYVYIARSWPR